MIKKNTIKIIISITIFFSFLIAVFSLFAREDDQIKAGMDYYKNQKYEQAVSSFSNVINDPNQEKYHGTAYFMMTKSYMALEKFDDAEKTLEYFLLNYKNHPSYEEASYLKGKLLYQQGDSTSAIQVFQTFNEKHPNSDFISNSYFFIGECLYSLGRIDDAQKMYTYVIQKYPISFKVEAARYRVSIIDFKKRENELLKLLKWSYEDTLKIIEEYQRRERTYEQAIASYQKMLAGADSGMATTTVIKEVRSEADIARIKALEAEVASLKKKIADMETQPQDATTDITAVVTGSEEDAARIKQLEEEIASLKKQIADLEAKLSATATVTEATTDTTVTTTVHAISGEELQKEKERLKNFEELLNIKQKALQLKEDLIEWFDTNAGSL